MRRDRDLMRDLLLEIEASDDPTGKDFDSRFVPYIGDGMIFLQGTEARPEDRNRDYQLIQLKKAGLIEFINEQRGADFYGGKVRLLPAGHDAIEAISDSKLWARLKSAAPSEAYKIIKETASSAAALALGAAMGWN